ncbi:MAG: glutamate-1-semialdehyde 2,1-aminomutase, partial [Bacteroidetes bacterium]
MFLNFKNLIALRKSWRNNISRIALGTVQFGLDYGISNKEGKVHYDEVISILKFFHENGFRVLDTAYGYGNSEEVIGHILSEEGLRFDIITKIPICKIEESAAIFSTSLERLKVNQVYGCLFHDYNFFKENSDYFIRFVRELKKKNQIGKWGVSVYLPEQIEHLLSNNIDFDIVQLPYNILDRRFEYLFAELNKRGIEIHCRSVFLQGLFYLGPDEIPAKLAPLKKYLAILRAYSDSKKISLPCLALTFVLDNKYIDRVIIGVTSLEQLKENIKLAGGVTDKTILADLKPVNVIETELIMPTNWTNNIVAITQARYGSSRLPGKILRKVNGKELLRTHIERIRKSKKITKLIVATTFEKESDEICRIAKDCGADCFQGSTQNVLERFYLAAKEHNADYVVRLTSDCPLVDPVLIDEVIEHFFIKKVDYASNGIVLSYPNGVDVEIMKMSVLKQAYEKAFLDSEKEHVTSYIWKNADIKGGSLFSASGLVNQVDYSGIRITVDEEKDFQLISKLIQELGDNKSWKEYADYIINNETLLSINNEILRNEGYMKSIQSEIQINYVSDFKKSEQHRKKVHNLIPGGAHTYSKGDDQFPALAPAAITHGKGVYVWDLDGNKYLDCSMGLSSVSLGHAYQPVLDRVAKELAKGVNFQRPSVIEMEMAEKFLSLVPCHQMIKFAKNGSAVTTAAVKLARAYTGRKLVAFPSDHPFYSFDDWFIGKTPCNAGVPEEFSNLSVTYKSDDLKSLSDLFDKHPGQIACVIAEPEKQWEIPKTFIKDSIDLAHKHGALYILDEMVTGFKTDFPGSIKKYNVEPDMATWGKGIANGFSFCALTGKKEIMESGGIKNVGKEKVFLISTTHGGETHAIAAGLATIEIFQTQNVIQHNHVMGGHLFNAAQSMISSKGLSDFIEVIGANWLVAFVFKDKIKEVCNGMRTLALQEMIKRGVLFQGIFIPCFSH